MSAFLDNLSDEELKNKGQGEEIEYLTTEQVDQLLNKYGPEGLYKMAEILIAAADEDINEAYNQSFDNLGKFGLIIK